MYYNVKLLFCHIMQSNFVADQKIRSRCVYWNQLQPIYAHDLCWFWWIKRRYRILLQSVHSRNIVFHFGTGYRI